MADNSPTDSDIIEAKVLLEFEKQDAKRQKIKLPGLSELFEYAGGFLDEGKRFKNVMLIFGLFGGGLMVKCKKEVVQWAAADLIDTAAHNERNYFRPKMDSMLEISKQTREIATKSLTLATQTLILGKADSAQIDTIKNVIAAIPGAKNAHDIYLKLKRDQDQRLKDAFGYANSAKSSRLVTNNN